MRYIDTSVLVAYLTQEANSPTAPLAVSTWTEVELLSALGLKIRTRQLTKSAATGIVDKYRQSISLHLCRLPVMNSDHVRASMLLDGWKSSLRAGDSLHLAISSARGATVYIHLIVAWPTRALLGIAVKLL